MEKIFKGKKFLVTGGAGFVGVPLIKSLLSRNALVRVIDRDDLKGIGNLNKVEFIKADIRDKAIVMEACQGVDYVFHNAAIVPVSRSKSDLYWKINVDGTHNILSASLENRVKKVIFLSSSAPYGIPKEAPITENTEFNPVCDYGRSKIEAENVCNQHRAQGLDVVILRPRTIVGQGRYGLFQILLSWIADNKNIYIIGKGDNLFSLLSERDLVKACILCIEKNCKNEDFNLGADLFESVRKDLENLITYSKSTSKLISVPAVLAKSVLKTFDMLNLVPFTQWHYMTADQPFYFDISKAKKILGWYPELSNFDLLKESYKAYMLRRNDIDSDFGITNSKAIRQRALKVLRRFS